MKSIIVTKKSVVHIQGNLFNITLNLQYLDGETILIDSDFTEHYATGEKTATAAKFKTRMQKKIDDYKSAQVIFNAAAMDTAITILQNELEV
ncbi:unnamed protein product [marine sediment metagenome]|uniref:Uncharacterized protein n=1 Tax=marine sediment metagenome TaxID=412755 RepID=X0YZF2_9ZZZZ